ADRLASHGKSPDPVLCTDMCKAQEIERLGFVFCSSFPVLFGKPPELDPARLFWMELQSKLCQSLVLQKAIRVCLILKSQNGVIGKTDDHYLALRPRLAPDVHPEIENVVHVDIREKRRNHRALRRTTP